MPTGNYSGLTITEPGCQSGLFRGTVGQRDGDEETRQAVLAKEPERQTASRRSSSSRGRSGMEEEAEQETGPRGRSAPRGSQIRGTQPRRASQGPTARRAAGPVSRTGRQKKSRRGFAAMSPEQQREIARKGGLTVSRNRRHMANIGRVGGEHSHGGRRARR